MRLAIVTGAIASLIAGFVSPANATLIAAFSQNPALGSTVTATDNGTTTNILISNVSTNVTAGDFTGNVLFDFNAHSIDPVTAVGPALLQHYTGNFCFTSGANCGGTNYLTGLFTDAAFGGIGGPGLVINVNSPPDTLTLTSSVVPASQLGSPSTFNLTFADLSPVLHVDGTTIAAFTADYSGTVSSTEQAVMEPASIAVLGIGLLGIGMTRLRKRNDGAQA